MIRHCFLKHQWNYCENWAATNAEVPIVKPRPRKIQKIQTVTQEIIKTDTSDSDYVVVTVSEEQPAFEKEVPLYESIAVYAVPDTPDKEPKSKQHANDP